MKIANYRYELSIVEVPSVRTAQKKQKQYAARIRANWDCVSGCLFFKNTVSRQADFYLNVCSDRPSSFMWDFEDGPSGNLLASRSVVERAVAYVKEHRPEVLEEQLWRQCYFGD